MPPELAGAPVVPVDATQHVLFAQPEAATIATEVLVGVTGGD